MAYPEDLIEHAIFVSKRGLPDSPDLPDQINQADLRRAVSAAYYALFHLLTTDAAENWKHERQRHRFARRFDHGRMKQCSSRIVSRPPAPSPNEVFTKLGQVADTFVKLQQARHSADYDNSKVWFRVEVWEHIFQASEAMDAWTAIREEEMAQDYLFDLMGER